MKLFRRIVILIVASLLVQTGGLLYIDRFYLSNETKIKSVKVTDAPKPSKVAEFQVSIPDDAKNIEVSYDSKYIAFNEGDDLKVLSTVKNTSIITVNPEKNAKISYYKWFKDRDTILTGEKSSTEDGGKIRFYTYDVSKNKKVVIRDNLNNKDTDININTKFDLSDLEMSSLTNVFYIKINRGGTSGIYVIDIMSQLQTIFKNKAIGEMLITRLDDKLVYESILNSKEPKIMVTNSLNTIDKTIEISGVSIPSLLGIDTNDNIYIGQVENNKVSKIFYGQMSDDTSKWKSISLPIPSSKEDINITSNGKIYVNDNLSGVITEVSSGIKTAYKGQFLQLYNGGIASKSDGKLVKTILK